jgi:hypothetical protein
MNDMMMPEHNEEGLVMKTSIPERVLDKALSLAKKRQEDIAVVFDDDMPSMEPCYVFATEDTWSTFYAGEPALCWATPEGEILWPSN